MMIRRVLLAGLVALLPLTATAQTTLRVALREDADLLDPTLARTFVGRIVFAGLCDKLFDINEKLEIVPQLATGYEWSDPKTLILHLRDGVRFHDGESMDAASVKYSLDRHANMPGSFRRSEIGNIDHVEIVDKLTVRVVLKTPSSPFLAQLTDRSGMIVSPKAAEASGKDFALHPVCAGPFKFTERVAQDRIVLDRFADYWNKDAIKIDRVIYQPIANSSIRLANLRAGSLDVVEYIIPTDADAVKSDPKLRLMETDSLAYETVEMNVGNTDRAKTPFGQDSRIRRAFELAIDRDALTQVVFAGQFTPTRQSAPSSSPFYVTDADSKPPARDVEAAKALLKQAGVALPVHVELLTPTSPDIEQAAEVIQAMTGEAGFAVEIVKQEFASSLDRAQRGDFQAYLLAWSGRVDLDGNTWSFLHSGGALNDAHYGNETVDELLDKARLITDVPQRRALYAQMWQQVHTDAPLLYLYQQKVITGLSAKVQGYHAYPDNIVRLQGVSLAR